MESRHFFKLIRHRPDIVMTSGYDSLGYWAALLYSKMFRKKFVVWWGSTLASSRVKNEWVNRIRSFFSVRRIPLLHMGPIRRNA
ncbi:hypothetical protein PACILC2_19550 [Paenibacillus cisolokensis]|uniref:Glycosyltransferase subfamily 4-like N-terminal domain-containing protein n=1 Tax=Paenibacillus cisolokensis TaxID=1658519 RepID=A0ABQ4N5E0_9BACL|nr:hypothetical protein [Paenibacillus cisolokensis]GIQ63387.1 hypothetical protein PACILC2_19550 [Paenibacillus cisolokensis]